MKDKKKKRRILLLLKEFEELEEEAEKELDIQKLLKEKAEAGKEKVIQELKVYVEKGEAGSLKIYDESGRKILERKIRSLEDLKEAIEEAKAKMGAKTVILYVKKKGKVKKEVSIEILFSLLQEGEVEVVLERSVQGAHITFYLAFLFSIFSIFINTSQRYINKKFLWPTLMYLVVYLTILGAGTTGMDSLQTIIFGFALLFGVLASSLLGYFIVLASRRGITEILVSLLNRAVIPVLLFDLSLWAVASAMGDPWGWIFLLHFPLFVLVSRFVLKAYLERVRFVVLSAYTTTLIAVASVPLVEFHPLFAVDIALLLIIAVNVVGLLLFHEKIEKEAVIRAFTTIVPVKVIRDGREIIKQKKVVSIEGFDSKVRNLWKHKNYIWLALPLILLASVVGGLVKTWFLFFSVVITAEFTYPTLSIPVGEA